MDPLITPTSGNAALALGEADFRLTAPSGFGDGWNHYAHSTAWFEGKLYVGTTRAQMAFMQRTTPPPKLVAPMARKVRKISRRETVALGAAVASRRMDRSVSSMARITHCG